MIKAIILNYPMTCVEVVSIPDELLLSDELGTKYIVEKVEEYLSEQLGYDTGSIAYMVDDEDCPVYNDDGELITRI